MVESGNHVAISQQEIASLILNLIAWEQPVISAVALVAINCSFWLAVSWNRRIFSILSLAAIALLVYKTWINQIWPEIRVPPQEGEDNEGWITVNPQVLSVPELSNYLNDFCKKMAILWRDVWRLRRENRGLFCALMCAFLCLIGLIGRLIPGVLIVYVAVLLLSLGPGVALHLIPSNLYDQMVGYFAESDALAEAHDNASKSGGNSEDDSDLEEFIPETSEEVIRQLSLREDTIESPISIGILSELSEGAELDVRELGVESFGNETDDLLLYQGLGAFPSVEEEGESEIDDEISEDIVPKEEEKTGILFVTSHFKEDSSGSESDAAFTEGLSFSGAHEEKITSKPAAGPSLKKAEGGVEKGTEETKKDVHLRKVSSSSDLEDELMDFEILEESDILS